MEVSLSDITTLAQGGGSALIGAACYFIYRLEQRLARIEKAFEIALAHFISNKEHAK